MRLAEIRGKVTLSRHLPQLAGGRFLLGWPLTLEALARGSAERGEELVIYDELGAGPGAIVAVSEGREAANPFAKSPVPIDAYCGCLIDQLDVDQDVALTVQRSS